MPNDQTQWYFTRNFIYAFQNQDTQFQAASLKVYLQKHLQQWEGLSWYTLKIYWVIWHLMPSLCALYHSKKKLIWPIPMITSWIFIPDPNVGQVISNFIIKNNQRFFDMYAEWNKVAHHNLSSFYFQGVSRATAKMNSRKLIGRCYQAAHGY